jgi:ATP-dependent helicase/nuclease subunit B
MFPWALSVAGRMVDLVAAVVTTAFGEAAIDTLARVLDRSSDPLAAALVICANPLVAVGVRRSLGTRPGGVAAVDVVTFDRLVEDLSQAALAEVGQRPAGRLELQAAIRRELRAAPGRFGSVAAHRTTEERLVRLDNDVLGLPREQLVRLAESPDLAGDAFRVLNGAADRLGSARVGSHVVQLAVEAIEQAPTGALGSIVVYLPEPTRPFEARLLSVLARRSDCTVLVGLTGHVDVDRRHVQRLAGSGIQLAVQATEAEAPTARVLEVADPEDEVRSAIREIVSWGASGTALSQMALLYSATDPYASLVEELLTAAGLPFSLPGHRPLSASLAGRTLARILRLVSTGLERSSVMTLVSSAPIVGPDGRLAAATAWDRLSRQAGVIDGDDWQPRLSTLAAHLSEDSEQQMAHDLLEFVADLDKRLHPDPTPQTWENWSVWALGLVRSLLRVGSSWPEQELLALERVAGVLDQLRTLDSFDPTPSFESFSATVLGELESAMVPGRPAGGGLLVAPLAAVAGLRFERLAIVGLAEGAFPRAGREDSLLPEQARALAGGWLLPKSALPHLDVRAVTCLVAAAAHRPLLTTARGDLRSRRSKVWPRLLDHLVTPDHRVTLDSHHRGLVDHGRPASLDDLGLRALVRHTDAGDPVHTHQLALDDQVLADGLARYISRHRHELTPHTGRVPEGRVDLTTRPLSPTALEVYAGCPRRYLFDRVLRIGDDERPERIEEITPRDRGTLVHRIFERFIGERITLGEVPDPDVRWSADQTSHMLELLDEEVVEAASKGVTGGRVQTEILRRQLHNEALDFLLSDDDLRASKRSRPVAVELEFGFDPDAPSILEIGEDHRLLMRGVVDRVDFTDDGGVLVIDYKGGSSRPFDKMEADPLRGGTRLQLPLYARIVAEQLDRHGPRSALYWLTKHDKLRELPLRAHVEQDLDGHVTAALDGIHGGLFPGRPGETVGWPRFTFENCKWCDFDRICPTDRQREWDDVSGDEALTPIDLLLGRDPSATAEASGT